MAGISLVTMVMAGLDVSACAVAVSVLCKAPIGQGAGAGREEGKGECKPEASVVVRLACHHGHDWRGRARMCCQHVAPYLCCTLGLITYTFARPLQGGNANHVAQSLVLALLFTVIHFLLSLCVETITSCTLCASCRVATPTTSPSRSC